MLAWINGKLRAFIDNPLGTATEWAVYLIFFGVGIAILVWAVRFVIGMVR